MWTLEDLGWGADLEEAFSAFADSGVQAGRVAVEHQHLYQVYVHGGELLAEVSGRLRHRAASRSAFPVTGDWIALRPRVEEGRATIVGVLPRRSSFSRKAAGSRVEEQTVAANVDVLFLVMGLDRDYNPRRLERYLALARVSGAMPVVLLSKSDLCPQAHDRRSEIEALGVTTHAISSRTGDGLASVRTYLTRGTTVALLGSSGVGKSTLVNRLAGSELLATREVRDSDQRGRHTTTRRELIPLPAGGLVIDTPGMRELQLWEADDGVEDAFSEIATLAERCRFHDCAHAEEPGCAVTTAVAAGRLRAERLESYRKLQKELRHLATKLDPGAQREERNRWRSIHRLARKHKPRG